MLLTDTVYSHNPWTGGDVFFK